MIWLGIGVGVVGTALAGYALFVAQSALRDLKVLQTKARVTEAELAVVRSELATLRQRTTLPALPGRLQGFEPIVNTLVGAPGRSPWSTVALIGWHGLMAYWKKRSSASRPERPRLEE